ncbi:uncharacterized protein LOC110610600 [Manihot esculenta]|uniref:uncharacterized protein LOC110610600 n=1 Tax=Manihot esculenta TaxID=3983 RepID=UPI000B5D8D16|nr:uncharacterized protein LOC110610600 [Manihot esculenta]
MTTPAWLHLFPQHPLDNLVSFVSDHSPLMLTFSAQNLSSSPARFQFENVWLKDLELIDLVTANWRSTSAQLLDHLRFYSDIMARWGGDFLSQFKRRIQWLKNELSHARSPDNIHTVSYYSSLHSELNDLLLKEEVFWKQRDYDRVVQCVPTRVTAEVNQSLLDPYFMAD